MKLRAIMVRKGWFRLAFVLSVAWIVVVVGYVGYQSR
jgi:hypothetical protein